MDWTGRAKSPPPWVPGQARERHLPTPRPRHALPGSARRLVHETRPALASRPARLSWTMHRPGPGNMCRGRRERGGVVRDGRPRRKLPGVLDQVREQPLPTPSSPAFIAGACSRSRGAATRTPRPRGKPPFRQTLGDGCRGLLPVTRDGSGLPCRPGKPTQEGSASARPRQQVPGTGEGRGGSPNAGWASGAPLGLQHLPHPQPSRPGSRVGPGNAISPNHVPGIYCRGLLSVARDGSGLPGRPSKPAPERIPWPRPRQQVPGTGSREVRPRA